MVVWLLEEGAGEVEDGAAEGEGAAFIIVLLARKKNGELVFRKESGRVGL